ncbi:hypothetical protein B566_EDAN006968 [Ephemera danica]|nr:hypothetical protein B566_EDAN006968 [Ephemera danica]
MYFRAANVEASPSLGFGGSRYEFGCNLCEKSFKYKSHASRHFRNIHGYRYVGPAAVIGPAIFRPTPATEPPTILGPHPRCALIKSRLTTYLRALCVTTRIAAKALCYDITGTFTVTCLNPYSAPTVMVDATPPAGMEGIGRKFGCNLCEKSFGRKGDLLRHFRNIHGDLSNPVQCSECHRFYKNENALHCHMYLQHRRPKGNVIPRNRTACHLATPPAGIRDGRLKFKCSACEKSYRGRSGLTQHFRNIHGDRSKSVQCDVCSKFCKNEHALDFHMYNLHPCHLATPPAGIRDGRLKFKCSACEKSYRRRNGLTQHFRNIHGDRSQPVRCVVCSLHCKNEHALKKHVYLMHRNNDN